VSIRSKEKLIEKLEQQLQTAHMELYNPFSIMAESYILFQYVNMMKNNLSKGKMSREGKIDNCMTYFKKIQKIKPW